MNMIETLREMFSSGQEVRVEGVLVASPSTLQLDRTSLDPDLLIEILNLYEQQDHPYTNIHSSWFVDLYYSEEVMSLVNYLIKSCQSQPKTLIVDFDPSPQWILDTFSPYVKSIIFNLRCELKSSPRENIVSVQIKNHHLIPQKIRSVFPNLKSLTVVTEKKKFKHTQDRLILQFPHVEVKMVEVC